MFGCACFFFFALIDITDAVLASCNLREVSAGELWESARYAPTHIRTAFLVTPARKQAIRTQMHRSWKKKKKINSTDANTRRLIVHWILLDGNKKGMTCVCSFAEQRHSMWNCAALTGEICVSLWLPWQHTLHSKQYSWAERDFSHLTFPPPPPPPPPPRLPLSVFLSIRASGPIVGQNCHYRVKALQFFSGRRLARNTRGWLMGLWASQCTSFQSNYRHCWLWCR